MRGSNTLVAIVAVLILTAGLIFPRVWAEDRTYDPPIAAASDEGQQAVRNFQHDPTLRVELVAAEPLLANPVAFCFDDRGRILVAETFRLHSGVTDTRMHMDWLDDDLACRTVEDRRAKYRRFLGNQFDSYATEHDRVRLLVDVDGDGTMDQSTVFADGFKDHVTGIGSGILARGRDVYYACIPDLWLLRDEDGDGRADSRRSLHHGYGVHTGFLGHDLHGLIWGPDGKLYFSIGDRGLNVGTEGRQIFYPDSGCVLRCNPDGSGLEILARGLRNPQELAFNEFGDLFTADNNSDGGDRARWVHVLEGGESGWHMGYQYLERRGPWNSERLWYPHFPGQAAYIVPPLANLGDGPSGLVYYRGTGLPPRYDGHFLLADFRGSSAQSGVRSFALRPRGGSYELVDSHQFLWGVLATDVEFGPDSNLYVLDWVQGWEKPTKGRIYRVRADAVDEAARREVARLLRETSATAPADEVLGLLSHRDMRVRQRAQFALAERGEDAAPMLASLSNDTHANRLARIHALWALGQIARTSTSVLDGVPRLLTDADPEIRAQAAKVLGDARRNDAFGPLVRLLADASVRVRLHAAIALGKLGNPRAAPGVMAMLRENADADPFLRHAGVMGLVGAFAGRDITPLLELGRAGLPPVRIATVLALRRLERSEIASFLNDPNPLIVAEAARAIYDVPIEGAMAALASLPMTEGTDLVIQARVLHANFRLGQPENAVRLARVSADADMPDSARLVALGLLRQWPRPPLRDGVVGLWRPLASRPREVAAQALEPFLSKLFEGPDRLVALAAETVGDLGLVSAAPYLHVQFADVSRSGSTRAASLKALADLGDDHVSDAIAAGVRDSSAIVRAEARRLRAHFDPAAAVDDLASALGNGTPEEQQKALATLGTMRLPAAEEVLAGALRRLQAGQVPPGLQLDVLMAAEQYGSTQLRRLLNEYDQQRGVEPLAQYLECMEGGDARRGETIFFENAKVFCQRCHVVGDRGGGSVGPELTTIARSKDRRYLLEAIVDPNRTIAMGYESIVLALDDGRLITGVLQGENDDEVRLITPEAITMVIKKSRIEERAEGRSAMPEQTVNFLTKSELRDLVEFLSTLR